MKTVQKPTPKELRHTFKDLIQIQKHRWLKTRLLCNLRLEWEKPTESQQRTIFRGKMTAKSGNKAQISLSTRKSSIFYRLVYRKKSQQRAELLQNKNYSNCPPPKSKTSRLKCVFIQWFWSSLWYSPSLITLLFSH